MRRHDERAMGKGMETTTDVGLVFEDFKDRVGSAFTLSEPEFPAIALTLEEATLLPIHSGAPITRPPFSLIFVGGGQKILPPWQFGFQLFGSFLA